MKKNYLLYSFVIVIVSLSIVSLISNDKEFSELENRRLKTSVTFSIKNFLFCFKVNIILKIHILIYFLTINHLYYSINKMSFL